MADNYIERHQEEYEARKEMWLRKKRHLPKTIQRNIPRPEDESL
ncbi:MAG: dehydrogenase [Prevotella sp.]|nr:dehydrogenase [Prevotella sp.]